MKNIIGIIIIIGLVLFIILYKNSYYVYFNYIIPLIFRFGSNKNKVYVIPDKMTKVVVSLTTSPIRIKKIKPVIDSMLNQTIKPDRIYLNLPKVFKRNGSTFDMPLPKFITDNDLIYVNFCDDIGPATKILPTINLINDPETLILSIDDDIHYPEHLIETFIAFSKNYPDSCITGSSYMFKKSKVTTQKNTVLGIPVELLEGYSGVLYKRKFFNETTLNQIYTWINENKGCKFGDDFSLSNALINNGTDIIMISRKYDAIWKIRPLDYGLASDALHLGASGASNANNYQICSDYLKTKGSLVIDYHRN
jgi:hypothetical protein